MRYKAPSRVVLIVLLAGVAAVVVWKVSQRTFDPPPGKPGPAISRFQEPSSATLETPNVVPSDRKAIGPSEEQDAFLSHARRSWELLRPLIQEWFFSGKAFRGPEDNFAKAKELLQKALLRQQNAAVLAALVIGVQEHGRGGFEVDQLIAITTQLIEHHKELRDVSTDPALLRYVLDASFDQALVGPAQDMAAYILASHTTSLFARRLDSIPQDAICLDAEALSRIDKGLQRALDSGNVDKGYALLRILGSYVFLSPEAEAGVSALLKSPPKQAAIRLHLANILANQYRTRIAENPVAFRFIMTCLQPGEDEGVTRQATLAIGSCPPLTHGDTPRSDVALTALIGHYRHSRMESSAGKGQGSYMQALECIAGMDVQAMPSFVSEVLADSTLVPEAKRRLLVRIQSVANGTWGPGHRYRNMRMALLSAIETVKAGLVEQSDLKTATVSCLTALASVDEAHKDTPNR